MTTGKKKSIYNPTAPAVEQAAQLLLCLGKRQESDLGLSAICREIGIHKSKGFSILNALSKYDLVTKDTRAKTYSLGPALMPLAKKAREKIDVHRVAKSILQPLAHETKTSVLLGIISNDQLYISGKFDGNPGISITVSQHQSLHITHGAHGKAIFAFLDGTVKQKIINADQLFFHGEPENLDHAILKKEIKFCREHGYAVDNGKLTPGTMAIASPVFDHNNQILAAVIMIGTFPSNKFEIFGPLTASAARKISIQAGAQFND